MPTQYFDDGSTFTYDDNGMSSTPAPAGALISDYSNNFQPHAVTPGASSWADVLKFGIGRYADYKVASLAPQNTAPTYAPQRLVETPTGGNFSAGWSANWMLWAGLGLAGLALAASLLKKG